MVNILSVHAFSGFLHAGFLVVIFTIAVVLLAILVRFLLVATKAAQVYIDKNSAPDDPGTPPSAG
jgi:LPS O-antigen subunit length determinant protein (WzzB/FepE family)